LNRAVGEGAFAESANNVERTEMLRDFVQKRLSLAMPQSLDILFEIVV